ncbi:MAG TPA: glutaredoxin family protein [Xanthomonadaceae bacterium]|nr:glutaredoxin family protein [Xanthomonadaceae bacterium]
MITASIAARSLTAFALLLLIPGLTAAQVQQVYRYIDLDGRVVYSDKPPPPTAKDAQAKRIGANSIETSDLSYATAQAQERYPVTLYSFSCGVVCDTAQGVLNKRGVPHTVIDVSVGDGAERLKRLSGGLDAPTIQVGDQYATGFNEGKWQAMLNDAGYPKTPPPRTTPVGRPPVPIVTAPSTTSQTVAAPPKGTYPQ